MMENKTQIASDLLLKDQDFWDLLSDEAKGYAERKIDWEKELEDE